MHCEDGPMVLSTAGMIPLNRQAEMSTWVYVLSSTPWGSRFTGLGTKMDK